PAQIALASSLTHPSWIRLPTCAASIASLISRPLLLHRLSIFPLQDQSSTNPRSPALSRTPIKTEWQRSWDDRWADRHTSKVARRRRSVFSAALLPPPDFAKLSQASCGVWRKKPRAFLPLHRLPIPPDAIDRLRL